MPQRQEGLRLVLRLLALLAVVLIPFGIYSYLYFDWKYDHHVNHNFRVLTEAGEHLSALLGQFEKLFESAPRSTEKTQREILQELVKERFKDKPPQSVVQEFLTIVGGTESNWKNWKKSKAVEEFMRDLESAFNASKDLEQLQIPEKKNPKATNKDLETAETKVDKAWEKVATAQTKALRAFAPDTPTNPYKGTEVQKEYTGLDQKFRKEEERYSRQLKKNAVYRNIIITPAKNKDCLLPRGPVVLKLDSSKAQTSLRVVACQQSQAEFAENFEAQLPLADLMRNAASEAENFDLLVLAQEDGTVIYNSAETPSEGIPKGVFAKFSSLKPFFQQDQAEVTPKETSLKNGQVSIPLVSVIREQVSIPLVSVIREAEISGTTYLLFLQPFQPPVPIVSQGDKDSADDQQVWYIGGIIRKSEFQKKFLAVPFTVTGLAVLGLILGILSLPYIKLFFANAGEPMTATDVFFLVVSLALGSGLITLLLLNTVAYHNMRSQFDETAEEIGGHIQERFGEELEETLDILSVAPCTVVLQESLELPQNRYPRYESVFLADNRGKLELENWITYKARKSAKGIDISKREYFLHAKDNLQPWQSRGWLCLAEASLSAKVPPKDKLTIDFNQVQWKALDKNFFIERVHSYTNGVKLSILSQHYQDCERNGQKEPCFPVAGLAKRFLSFRSLALPPNFGFAVIEDDSGTVIFHSDDQRSLIENFFWETDNNLTLQAAVQVRQDCKSEQVSNCKIAGQYNGRKHHFFVTPIESVPWSLVVFYDTRLLETVNFEIGVVAAGIFFLYVAIFVLGIAIIHLLVPGKHWSWCWPQSKFEKHYFRLTVLLSGIVLSYGLGIWLLEGRSLLLLVVSLPLFVLGLLYLCFKLKRQDGGRRWKRLVAKFVLFGGLVGFFAACFVPNISSQYTPSIGATLLVAIICFAWITLVLIPVRSGGLAENRSPKLSFRFWYLSVVFLSALVVFVLPSAAIFKDVFLTQSERFTKFRESEFMTALDKRERTLLGDMYNLAKRDEVKGKITEPETFVKEAIEPGLHKYEGDTNQGGPHGKKTENGYLSDWFIDFLPVYNELAGELRYPVSKQVGLSRLEYSAHVRYQALPSPPTFLPRWDLNSVYQIAIYLCIFLFLFVLFLLIRALAKRTVGLYLYDFEVLEKDSEGTTIHKLIIQDTPDEKTAVEWAKEIERCVTQRTDTKTVAHENRQILVRPPRALVSKLEGEHADPRKSQIVDLSSPIPTLLGELRGWSPALPQRKILVTNFEVGILEPRLRFALLEALECVQAETPVILCSSVSPLYRLVTPEAYPEFDEGIRDAVLKVDEKFRWSVLLSTFRKERFWYEAADWRKRKEKLQILSRECCWTDELIPIYAELKDNVKDLTEEQIIHQVGDRAGAFYRKLWMLCTKEERLVLIHLAQGNMVNLKETDVLQRLLWRNLVRRDPDFRLPNESFANFILTAESSARIVEWEKGEADGSTWTMLRVPLLLLLVLVAAFIARTGGEGVQAMTAIVSAVFAGLPILLQALSFLRGGQTDKLTGE